MAIRVACVSYLNTVPLIEGLSKAQGVTLSPMIPSRIADAVISGEADVGLASVIDAARHDLAILPGGVIACDGPTLTVRLFSSTPFDRIAAVHADADSHTSVALCRIVLAERHGVRPEVIAYDARERVPVSGGPTAEWPDALLLIGDKVVTESPPVERYPHQLDLGQAWKELTGLPFVYAAWMCRSERAGDPAIEQVAALLDRQRRRNVARLDWIVDRRAGEHRWPTGLARRYLGQLLRYELGEREAEAIAEFLRRAAAIGACDGARAAAAGEGARQAARRSADCGASASLGLVESSGPR
ncbi:MAG: menaquinone biosynthesis protein [Phycisphaerae bacterium]|nr:menaquinone biosynthesis protein [Phycisphaerae bacterium]